MPTAPATRNEPSILTEDALTLDALGHGQLTQRPHALAAEGAAKRSGIAPAQKTGVGGVVSRPKPDTWLTDTLLSGLQKGLDLSLATFKRYGTEQGRSEDALNKAFQDSFEAMIKAQGTTLVEQAPFGKAILVTFELSLAFAEGVGTALTKVNAELADKYDVSKVSADMDEQDVARVQAMRGYQQQATKQLGRVVAEGLAQVAEKALDMVLAKLGEIPGKVLNDVASQIAGQLVRQNDLLAILREAVEESGKSIPAGRAKIERMVFHFASSAWLSQLEDKELQKKLAALPGVAKSDKPVDVALLGTLIKMLAEGSYDTYTSHVPVGYVQSELKTQLVEAARGLAAGLVGVKLEPSRSGTVEIEATRIGVPATWLPSLTEPSGTPSVLRDRWWNRQREFIDYLRRRRLALDVRRRQYQRSWAPHAATRDPETWVSLQNRWVDDYRRAQREARDCIDAIIEEFGEAWLAGTARTQLGLDVDAHLGWEREAPAFAPRPW